jgi:hypothetical protein
VSDGRDKAGNVKTIANLFHLQISDPSPDARQEVLNIFREQNREAQQRGASALPEFFLRDDGAGDRFPAMKEPAALRAPDDADEGLGAPKGRRRREAEAAPTTSAEPVSAPEPVRNEVQRPLELPQAEAPQQQQQQFDVIRL